jgi:hypothetical protein
LFQRWCAEREISKEKQREDEREREREAAMQRDVDEGIWESPGG